MHLLLQQSLRWQAADELTPHPASMCPFGCGLCVLQTIQALRFGGLGVHLFYAGFMQGTCSAAMQGRYLACGCGKVFSPGQAIRHMSCAGVQTLCHEVYGESG
jgi:hypothetical protein